MMSLVLTAAMLLDRLFGEPKNFHPLVGFGHLANNIEAKCNSTKTNHSLQKFIGGLCWFLLVLPLPICYWLVRQKVSFYYQQFDLILFFDCFILYLALGLNSLKQHGLNVFNPLSQQNLQQARDAVSLIVSRRTDALNEHQLSRATVESILENGHDAVIASLFWYVIGGIPLVIAHRLANTLDAMWGYKNERFINFGWFSAKADDLLGWPSAKITSLVYIFSHTLSPMKIKTSLINAFKQGNHYKSLNGGWVMSAGASTLNIQLGGSSEYYGEIIISSHLGQGAKVFSTDITRSLSLVNRASWFFILIIFMGSLPI